MTVLVEIVKLLIVPILMFVIMEILVAKGRLALNVKLVHARNAKAIVKNIAKTAMMYVLINKIVMEIKHVNIVKAGTLMIAEILAWIMEIAMIVVVMIA